MPGIYNVFLRSFSTRGLSVRACFQFQISTVFSEMLSFKKRIYHRDHLPRFAKPLNQTPHKLRNILLLVRVFVPRASYLCPKTFHCKFGFRVIPIPIYSREIMKSAKQTRLLTVVMLVGAAYKVDCMKQQYEARISVTQGKGVGEPSCVSKIVSFA